MKIPTKFNVSLYGNLKQITPTLSQCRVRIFYKGMNRNRTYITEDFANQLIASLPYAPVKGIFDYDEVDYDDHGKKNSDGRIYGVVKENPNFAWEDHLDEDGVTRTYACADVLLFTALYPEAKLIPEKGQSMEIYQDNLVGQWKIAEDGEPYYLFKEGCFIGLQILGDEVEPCFEGAAFYNLCADVEKIAKYLKDYEREVEKEMEKTLFRLSDNDKLGMLENLLNPNFTEEGGWIQDRVVLEVYDEYVLCYNIINGGYERAYYTKEGDNVSVGDISAVFVVDVTAEELSALDAIKAASGSYSAAQETVETQPELKASLEAKETELTEKETTYSTEKAELEEKISTLEASVAEYEKTKTEAEAQIAEFSKQVESLEAEKVEFEQKIADITSENESLTSFKLQTELKEKEDILDKYQEYLNEETYGQFKTDIDKYTVTDFKKEVCTAAVETTPSIFDRKDPKDELVYTGKGSGESYTPTSAIERILNKYVQGGNK